MSDTTIQECTICGFETDCIEGLCQECVLELQAEIRLMSEEPEIEEPEPDRCQEPEDMPVPVKTDLF